jgi:hypothetical protein
MKNKFFGTIKPRQIFLSIILFFFLSFNFLSAQSIVAATGGANISLDKSSAGISPGWTTLSGPVVREDFAGEFAVSDYYLFVSSEWQFDTTQPVTISVSGGDPTFSLSASSYLPTAHMLVFHVSSGSTTRAATLSFSNIRIQPTGIVPSSDMLKSTLKNGANFGTLSTTVGTESAYRISAATNTPTAGINDQLTITIVDQFQNIITTSTGYKNLTFSGLSYNTDHTAISHVTDYLGTAVSLGVSTQIHFTGGVSDVGGLLFPLRAEGPVTLSATDGTISTTSAGGSGVSLTISPNGVSYLNSIVSVSQSVIAPSATSTVTLQSRDAYGNNINTGGATVVFTQSTGAGICSGTFSSVTDNGNGNYTTTFTGVTQGNPTTISATYNGNPITSTLPTIRVINAGPANAYKITAATSTPVSGTYDQLTLTIVDANQVTVTSFTGDKNITFSGLGTAPDGISIPTVTNSSGTPINLGTATVIHFTSGVSDAGAVLKAYKAEGPVTLNATDGTLSTTSTGGSGVSLAVSPGITSYSQTMVSVTPSIINPGSTTTVTLHAKDLFANDIKIGGATVIFSLSGGTSTGTFGAVTDNHNGTYSSIFTGALQGTAATINATFNSNNITSTLPTITVAPFTISTATSTVSVSSPTVIAGSSVIITLQAKNAAGTNLTSGGGHVAFTYSGGTSTGTISVVTDHGNGTYTATFTGNRAGTPTTIYALISDSTVLTPRPTIGVTPASVSYLKAIPAATTMINGTTNEISLVAYDLYGNVSPSYSGLKTISFTGLQTTETIEGSTTSANVNFTEGVSANGALTFQARVARNAYLNFSDGVYGTSADISYAAHITITPAIPTVPVATSATNITSTGFIANWIPSVDATEYFLDVATDQDFNDFVSGYINSNVGNVTYAQVSGLTANTTYFYRVRAGNSNTSSASSNVISLTTLQTKPNAPVANAASSIDANEFTANWTASAVATGYFLDVALDNAFTLPVSGFIGKNVGNVTSFKVTHLDPTTTYFYRVRAYNAQGESTNSNVISVSTITGVDQLEGEIQTTFKLFQNYPNPFNPTTKIQFGIPKNVMVRLSIYNIIGQEIATLVNREMSQGLYSIEFDATKLNNGIYFYNIQAGDFSQTKKMILLK